MIIDGYEYKSFIYGHELEKSPKVKDFGIDETDLQECKSYDDAMKKYHSELDGCCENRGYYLAVPLWIAEFTFWFFNNYGMLSRVSFDDILSIVVLVFVWGLEFVVSIFLGGVLIIALQAWLLKWILPKSLVKYVVGLAIKMPRRSKKYDKVCCYLQAKSRYAKFAHEYDKIYPNIRNFEYDLKAYGQAKMLELVDKLKEYIKEQNEIIKKENIRQSQKFWFDLDPYEFENEVALWYERKGYNCKVTKKSGDGGVDIVLTKGGKKAYVQCKRYTTSKVDRPTLNQLY